MNCEKTRMRWPSSTASARISRNDSSFAEPSNGLPPAPSDQARVAADLAQPEELGQGRQPQARLARAGSLEVEQLALGLFLE